MLNFSGMFNGPYIFLVVAISGAFLLLSFTYKDKTSKFSLLFLAVLSFVFFISLKNENTEYMENPETAIFIGEYVDTLKTGTGASARTYFIFVNSEGEKKGFDKIGIVNANDNNYPIEGLWYVVEYAVDTPLSQFIISIKEFDPSEQSIIPSE